MCKSYFICVLICLVTCIETVSQSSLQPTNSDSTYYPAAEGKESWQRLYLMLSSTFWHVVKEGQIDLDSSLLYASRSLGLSRLSVLAEGIDDPELLAQSEWIDQRNPGKGHRILALSTGQRHLETLLLLGSYYAFEPPRYNTKDSAKYFLTKVIDESGALKDKKLTRHAHCLFGKFFFDINDIHRGDSVFNRLVTECEAEGDKKTAARAYEYWGLYSPFSPATTQDRIYHLQKAADIYHGLDMPEGEINVRTDIGYLYVASARVQDAYDVFLKALELAESIKYPYIHYNTEALAMVTTFQGKFGEPLKYGLQTIKLAESARDSIGWAYFYGRLSGLYKMDGGKEKERMVWLKKAFDRFVLDQNPSVYNLFYDVVGSMNKAGRSQEALELVAGVNERIPAVSFTELSHYHLILSMSYSNLGEFDLATTHLSKADSLETLAESFRGPLRRAFIYYQQAYIYLKQHQYENGRSFLEKYLTTYSPGARPLGNDIEVLRELISIDSKLNDNASSLRHYKQYALLLDSNYRVSKTRQAEELLVMYQTQEKENQIVLLNQRAKIEQANLKQATLIKNMTIAGIVAALIIVALLYRQNRLRKNTNTLVTQKNEQLEHFLNEKGWLLKEIHHRVKNNLQIVMSLLNRQSAYIDNEPALTAIQNSQNRVHAMSLIHQKLYNSENLSSIDMSFYIRELTTYLRDSFSTGQRVHFEFCIEPLQMDVIQAVPLGLILNEAITNSIKYAFPDDRNGVISISLYASNSHQMILSISDNGIGIPFQSNFNHEESDSLGMSLMQGLTEDLGGDLSIENNNGTTIKVSFVKQVIAMRQDTLVTPLVSHIQN